MKEFTPKKRTGRNESQGLNQHRSKMSELEFRTTIIRILTQVEKSKDTIECISTEIKK